MRTLVIDDRQAAIIKTALEWYADDRRECAKYDRDPCHPKAASDAMDLLGEIEQQGRSPTKLYMIESSDGPATGENYDLYVRAGTEAEAVTYWRGYYDLTHSATPTCVRVVPSVAGPAGAIPWE